LRTVNPRGFQNPSALSGLTEMASYFEIRDNPCFRLRIRVIRVQE